MANNNNITTTLVVDNIKTGIPVVVVLDAIKTALSDTNTNNDKLVAELARLQEILLDGQQGFIYDSFTAMRVAFTGSDGVYPSYALGDELFIKEADEPDWWVSGVGITQGSLPSLPNSATGVEVGKEYYVSIDNVGYGLTASKSRVIDMGQYEEVANKIKNFTNVSDIDKTSEEQYLSVKALYNVLTASTGAWVVQQATNATNAANATKAQQDQKGNVIDATYATNARVSEIEEDLEDINGAVIKEIQLNGTKVNPVNNVVNLPNVVQGADLDLNTIILGDDEHSIISSKYYIRSKDANTDKNLDSVIPTYQVVDELIEGKGYGDGDAAKKDVVTSLTKTTTSTDLPTAKAVVTYVEDRIGDAGKIDDVQINGTSVVSNKVANIALQTNLNNATTGQIPDAKAVKDAIDLGIGGITIDPLQSNYESYTIAQFATSDGPGSSYYGFKIVDTDVPIEVYSNDGSAIITQNIRTNGYLYITVDKSLNGHLVYLRRVGGNQTNGNGSVSPRWVDVASWYISGDTSTGSYSISAQGENFMHEWNLSAIDSSECANIPFDSDDILRFVIDDGSGGDWRRITSYLTASDHGDGITSLSSYWCDATFQYFYTYSFYFTYSSEQFMGSTSTYELKIQKLVF